MEKPLSGTLIDTHCHVDAYPDPASILASAASAGVEVIAVTNSPDAYNRLATLLPRSGPARPALGLHPSRRPARHGRRAAVQPDGSESRVDRRDRPRLLTRRPRQPPRAARRLRSAGRPPPAPRPPGDRAHQGGRAGGRPRLASAGTRAVLHWYTGPPSVADDALAAGLSFSVNPAMAASAKGRGLLSRLPHDRVLLETDGPYARVAGSPCSPDGLPGLIETIARLWQAAPEYVHETITGNQQRITA